MKKRNKNLLLSAIFSSLLMGAISTNAMAQKRQHGPDINHEQVLNSLNLTDDVRASLEQIMNAQKAKMDSMRQKMEGERYQAHLEQRVIHEENKEQVKALLTKEQFAAFEEAMWIQRQQMPPRGHGMQGRQPMPMR